MHEPSEVARRIAQEELRLPTLDRRKSDRLDFYTLAVWDIERALVKAYEAGYEAAVFEEDAAYQERYKSAGRQY